MSRAASRAPSRAPSRGAAEDDNGAAQSEAEAPSEEFDDFKRIIICCDGTWLDSSQGLDSHGNLIPPSNVSRISHAIRAVSKDGIPQVVYYQGGVGSTGTTGNKVIGGIVGAGLSDNVRDAYTFIANNWVQGDEIFCIGFSRGAFTARSVAGLVTDLGVMTKAGLPTFPVVFEPNIPFPDKPPFRDPSYVKEMERRGLTTLKVRVRAVAVWDTVGSLGIPRISWLSRLGQKKLDPINEYSFYDTTLSPLVDNAFQALALDEKRASFQPAVWEKRRNEVTNLVQVWFPGVHANVGGGYDDQELANISLAWMMSMLAPFLDLNLNYVLTTERQNMDYYASTDRSSRPWSFGKIYDSVTGVFAVAGSIVRTPGNYCRTDPRDGENTYKLLRNTNEYIHASVRTRIRLRGPGYADRGDYDPPALRTYRLRSDAELGQTVEGLPTGHFWEQETGEILPEAPLRQVEKLLLRTSPDVEDYLFGPPRQPERRRS